MADMLSTAVSALRAYRVNLDTASHNIANVGTDGYSRQTVQMATREPQAYGNGYIGSGVDATTVRRAYDEFVTLQNRSASSSLGRQDTFAAYAERINTLYADTSTGLGSTLQSFVNALQGVASAPSSMSARQVMISQASALAGQMSDYNERLDAIGNEINQQLASDVTEVNSIAASIADLNGQIVIATGRNGQPPNDLLDQRDKLIDQLSQKVAVNTVRQDDGSLNVFVGSGQTLVLGSQATTLVATPDAYDASLTRISMQTPSGPVDVTRSLTGGEIGGMLDFRSAMLDPARNALGQLAVGIASLVNSQQAAGVDLNGVSGTALFAVGGVDVLSNAGNSGGVDVAVTRTDATQITQDDYYLQFTGGAWVLHRTSDGSNVAMGGSGTVADPFTAEGLSIQLSGTPAEGDKFLLRPTQSAASGMGILFTDPARLAAALPVVASISASNTGTARLGDLTVTDATNPNLRTSATITFPTAGTYSVNGGPATAYTPGTAISANGWSLVLEGTPAAGDTFTVGNNANGVGDNRNFLALADRLSQGYLEGGSTSINGALSRIVADVGVQTRQAQVSRDALGIVHQDSVAARDAVSGVNLDEEAANLIKFQQAYQAAAQMIQVANATFDALIGAIAR